MKNDQPCIHIYPPAHSMDEWTIWLNPDRAPYKAGICLATGETREAARQEAIAALIRSLSALSSAGKWSARTVEEVS